MLSTVLVSYTQKRKTQIEQPHSLLFIRPQDKVINKRESVTLSIRIKNAMTK